MKTRKMYGGGVLILLLFSFSLVFFGCKNNSDDSNSSNDSNNTTNNGNPNNKGNAQSFNELVAEMPADKEMKGFGAPEVAETETEGIRIKFVVPKGAERLNLYIDGIGNVCEAWDTQDGAGTVFYPFVNKGKTYKILLEFVHEISDSEGYTSNIKVGWKMLEVTAKGGKGEVLVTKNPDILISPKNNGDFTLTAPTFSNESLVPNWYVIIGLCAGTSWEREDYVRSKWHANFDVKNSELDRTHNFYLEANFWCGESWPIEFICYMPRVDYTDSNGKTWNYRWDAVVKDNVNLPSADKVWKLATSTDLSKLVGTWEGVRHQDWWDERIGDGYPVDIHEKFIIKDDGKTEHYDIWTVKKGDGSAFTTADEDLIKSVSDKWGTFTFDAYKKSATRTGANGEEDRFYFYDHVKNGNILFFYNDENLINYCVWTDPYDGSKIWCILTKQ